MADLATESEAAKGQILAAGAQAGQAGVDAYAAAQREIDAQRNNALAIAQNESRKIGADNLDFNALISSPLAAMSGALTTERTSHQMGAYARALGGAEYSDKIGKLSAIIAAQAAASGGGGGGGGGSGGGGGGGRGGGGGGDYSDSELRVVLKGAAQDERAAQAGQAASGLQAAKGVRKMGRGAVNQARTTVKQQKKQVQRLRNQADKDGRRTKAERRQIQSAKGRLADARETLRGAKKGRVRAVTQQRQAYGTMRATALQPLGPLAQAIGVDAGYDPNRVSGLFGPSEQATLRNADIDELKDAGGALEAFGRPPMYGTFGASKKLKLEPEKVKVMRGSANYRTLANYIEEAVANGDSLAEVSRGLESWRRPSVQKVKNAKGKTVTQRTPGHANLVNLVLLDYGPAFQR